MTRVCLRRPHTPDEARAYLIARSVATTDGCLLLTLAHNGDGYCQTTYQGEFVLAHRLAFAIEHGPIPDGMTIDHKCKRRNCVAPAHLRAVSFLENLAGRSPHVKGEPAKSRPRGPQRRATATKAMRRFRARQRAEYAAQTGASK